MVKIFTTSRQAKVNRYIVTSRHEKWSIDPCPRDYVTIRESLSVFDTEIHSLIVQLCDTEKTDRSYMKCITRHVYAEECLPEFVEHFKIILHAAACFFYFIREGVFNANVNSLICTIIASQANNLSQLS